MGAPVAEYGTPYNATATGTVGPVNRPATLLGFYVNSTSSGTLVFRNASGGAALNAALTPAAGAFHRWPAHFSSGIHITVGGTIDVTFFVIEGP